MAKFILSAFADEAGTALEEQIAALKRNDIGYIEPRNINGKPILTLTDEELAHVKSELDKNGIKVNSLGSPIGKYPISEPFEKHLIDFNRALEVCKALGTDKMRMFSFFMPEGEEPSIYKEEVIKRLKALVKVARFSSADVSSRTYNGTLPFVPVNPNNTAACADSCCVGDLRGLRGCGACGVSRGG